MDLIEGHSVADWKHEFIQANGICFHYVTMGKGPLVLLLHGFPQFWYAWRHQIPVLAKHFHVVALDLRGYGQTEKPLHISEYHINVLSADILKMIQALGFEKAHLVGHDWGGAIAWRIALDYPHVVDHLAVLNCPHPYLFSQALHSNFKQICRSWYIVFFQIPYLPEWVLKMGSKIILKHLFRSSTVRIGTFNDEDIEQYDQALQKPGAINGAINYYRAAFRKKENRDKVKEQKKISAPTLVIWGESDKVLGKELTVGMESLFSAAFSIHYIANCGHWVNEEQPGLVNRLLIQFLDPYQGIKKESSKIDV